MAVDWFKIGFTGPEDTSFKMAEYFIEESTFSFRVLAENEAGKSLPLELHEPIVIRRKKRTPEPVCYLRMVEKSSDSVTLRWKSFSSAYQTAEKFIVEKRDKSSLDWNKVGQTKSETFTVDDLTPNACYLFRVTAVNDAGSSEPVEVTDWVSLDISSEVPSKPISISIDEVTQTSVTLSWISPKNSGAKPITGYKIYKMAVNINTHWQEVDHIGRAKKLSYTIIDLDHNYEYRFRICAVSDVGVGKPNETEKIQLKKPISNLNIYIVSLKYFF